MAGNNACRERITSLYWQSQNKTLTERSAHSGLLLAKYLKEHDSAKNAKRQLLDVASKASSRAAPLYDLAFRRWEATLANSQDYPAASNRFHIQGRMAIGLGGASVLETGLTLHHTYGTSMIPGSALKGLAAHYCDQVWGLENTEFRLIVKELDEKGKQRTRPGEYYATIFGSQQDAGHISFHDAWITPQGLGTALQIDVMTPHHQKYYGEPQESDEHPPTDFDDPVPVAFLSITGEFLVALTCDVPGPNGRQWVDLTFELLTRALKEWGIGAKTNSGYGRLKLGPAPRPEEAQPKEHQLKKTFSKGTKIRVKRIDHKGKKGLFFEAEDGMLCQVMQQDDPCKDVKIGEDTELWVVNTSPNLYTLSSSPPTAKKSHRK
jgi:CRISPR-associated protein Cmr6